MQCTMSGQLWIGLRTSIPFGCLLRTSASRSRAISPKGPRRYSQLRAHCRFHDQRMSGRAAPLFLFCEGRSH
jgi:hypothetical protein